MGGEIMSTTPNKSTTAHAQCERLIELLRQRPHNSHELTEAGIYHPPARIRELRKMGHNIQTHRVNLTDRWGYEHQRCGLFELHETPLHEQQNQRGGGV
jgi:hypothetical protein